MAKTKRNPVISNHATRRIGDSETPIALLTDLWALHLLPYAQEQWSDVFTAHEWEFVREAAEISRFDTRRDPKIELASLVALAFEYAESGTGDLVESDLVAKIKRMNLLQAAYVLFVISRAESSDLRGDEWWCIGTRPSQASSETASRASLASAPAAD